MRTRVRPLAALLLLAATCLTLSFAPGTPAGAVGVGGPVIIMGIDGEDGGPGGHGPIVVYDNMINTVKAQVSNGGSGILVIGGGKDPGDSVTRFWDQIGIDTGNPITYVNGAANISAQPFGGFAILAVAGDEYDTYGGITAEESVALAGRSFDIATFVNNGGGLYVMQQGSNAAAIPYGFLGDLGTFVAEPISAGSTSDIDVTPAGAAAGITDELDVCCWHDQFITFPSFLTVLATYAGSTEVAALGGANVQIPTGIVLDPPAQQVHQGTSCTVVATITENEQPAVGREVRFFVLEGPNAPQAGVATSDANGLATFSYVGNNLGDDTIAAEFTDSQGRLRTSNAVLCGFVAPPTTTTTTAPPTTAPAQQAATAVRANPRFTG